MELSHVRLMVSNFEAAYRFYRDVLQLHPQHEAPKGPYVKFSFPGGGAAIALQSRAHFEAHSLHLRPGSGDDAVLAIHVKDVEAEARALRARGAEVSEVKRLLERMKVAYLRDPEGTLIELQEW